MGNYENLKAAIADVITTNGNNEITGAVLRQVLQTMVSSIGGNATFGGVVTPETNVGTPDQNVFYVANTPGVYQYMGGATVGIGEIAFFTNTNKQWVAQTIVLDESFASFVDGSTFDVLAQDDRVEVGFNTADGEPGAFVIPSATTEKAGTMTAEDKKNATVLTGILFKGSAISGDVIFTSSVVSAGQWIELSVDEIYSTGGIGYFDSENNIISSTQFSLNTKILAHIPEGFSFAKVVWDGNFQSLTVKTRTALSELENKVNTIFTTEVEFTEGNYLTFSGITSSPYNNAYCSDIYPVNKLNRVVYSGKSAYNAAACVIFDSEKNVISTVPSASGGSVTSYDEQEISLPENAAFIRFGSYEVEPEARIESPFASIQDVESSIESIKEDITIQLVAPINGNYLQEDGTISAPYAQGYYSEFVVISELTKLTYSGRVQYLAKAWCLYDKDKNLISSYPTGNQSTALELENTKVSIPENASYIRFGSMYSPFNVTSSLKGYATEEDIVDLRTQIDVDKIDNILAKKSVIWVGDSIMEGSVRMTPPFGGWAKIIADRNSMQSTNYGIGGTCITHIEGKTNAIVDRLQNYSKDVDYCIVQGGLNDTAQAGEILGEITNGYTAQLDTSTYCGAMEFICKYLATNYSDKKYGFIVTFQISSTKWNTTWGDKTVEILKKWGIPYIDLRYCAGFNLASPDMRKFFGTYIGDVALYDSTKGYVLDEQVKYNGALYKANVDIPSPAGEFDAGKWTLQESDNVSDYDNWHCNVLGYKKLADVIEMWMRSL